MPECYFVTDLHGRVPRYQKLFDAVAREAPAAVFLGGDFLPPAWPGLDEPDRDFIRGFLGNRLLDLRRTLRSLYPRVFLIMGNDDPRAEEIAVGELAEEGIWEYIQGRKTTLGDIPVFGYAYVNPTPFRLKDWERYDVSRYVDPGAVSPEEGFRTVPVPERETRYHTIQEDLERLTKDEELGRAIILFHAPPYQTKLDLSALAGKTIDHVPLDRHLGSIAVRRFIETRRPFLTLHGHVHESARLSGSWRDRIGATHCFSAAHDGPELALVRFNPGRLDLAVRSLV